VVHPALAIPLAFGSHFILDKLPHWNPHLNKEIKKYGRPSKTSTIITAIDSSAALFVGTLIASRALPDTGFFLTIMLSCFAAVLPDVVEAPYYFLGIRNKTIKKWIDSHRSIQSNTKSVFWGIQAQIIIIIAALWWIFN
jgi:hypothetical protein